MEVWGWNICSKENISVKEQANRERGKQNVFKRECEITRTKFCVIRTLTEIFQVLDSINLFKASITSHKMCIYIIYGMMCRMAYMIVMCECILTCLCNMYV